jgi:hypothetical protein
MPFHRLRQHIACFVALLLSLSASAAWATPQPAPPGGPLTQFEAHDPNAEVSVYYDVWANILSTVMEEKAGRFEPNYGGLGQTGRDAIDIVLTEWQGIRVTALGRDEQLAYWLNLYNLASLKIMFDTFTSMGKASQDIAGRNPWANDKFNVKRLYTADGNPWATPMLTVEGVSLSLNDIEHRILYAFWPAEQVMYGLSCPVRGCPDLPSKPYAPAVVNKQLAAAATRFVADPENAKLKGAAVRLSELYRWHQGVLGGEAKVLAHVIKLAGRRLAGATSISGYDFDWKLAGKQPPASWTMPRGQMNRGAGAGGMIAE